MEKKKLTLTSLNKEEYPDKEVECVVVKDMKAYVQYLLKNGAKVRYAQKTVPVSARVGVVGETKGKVKVEGSMIVKNPDGEEYIVKPDKFASKYRATSEKGVYKPTDGPIKYVEIDQDIAFTAPWGEEMYGVKGAVLNISSLDDVYAIQNEAFSKTYTNVERTKE